MIHSNMGKICMAILTVDANISCGQQYNKKLLQTFVSLNCTWYLLVSPVNMI